MHATSATVTPSAPSRSSTTRRRAALLTLRALANEEADLFHAQCADQGHEPCGRNGAIAFRDRIDRGSLLDVVEIIANLRSARIDYELACMAFGRRA